MSLIGKIKEFNIMKSIQRYPKYHKNESYGGRNCVFLGMKGSGKTVLVLDYLYQLSKAPTILLGTCIAPSDAFNHDFQKHIPHRLIHYKYSPELMETIVTRQKAIKAQSCDVDPDHTMVDTRTFVILDDMMQYVKEWSRDVNMVYILSAGRHIDINLIITSQDPLGGIPPAIRTNIDYVFICKEPRTVNRHKLYLHWCGCFESQKQFDMVLKEVTSSYRCLVVNNSCTSYNLLDAISWYKPKFPTPEYKLCAEELWVDNDKYKTAEVGINPAVILDGVDGEFDGFDEFDGTL